MAIQKCGTIDLSGEMPSEQYQKMLKSTAEAFQWLMLDTIPVCGISTLNDASIKCWKTAFKTIAGETTCNEVRYIYNCSALAIGVNGEMVAYMPSYHAAVVFYLRGDIACIMLVKDRELLNKLRQEYGPARIKQGSTTVAKLFGERQMEVMITDARQEPIRQEAGQFDDFILQALTGWPVKNAAAVTKMIEATGECGTFAYYIDLGDGETITFPFVGAMADPEMQILYAIRHNAIAL